MPFWYSRLFYGSKASVTFKKGVGSYSPNLQSRNPTRPLSSADDVFTSLKTVQQSLNPSAKRHSVQSYKPLDPHLNMEKRAVALWTQLSRSSSMWRVCWSVMSTFFLTTVADVMLTIFTGSLESGVGPSFRPPDWKPSSTIILSGFEWHNKRDFSLILLL